MVQVTLQAAEWPGLRGIAIKSREIEAQGLSVAPNAEQKNLLSRFANRLLNLRAGTPVTYTRKNLGPKRSVLDEMISANLIRIVGGQYLPTFRGIEALDADIRQLVRGNLNCVFAALQRLYGGSGAQYTFSFEAIVEEAKKLDPTRDAKDVLPALIIGEEFGYHYFENGIQEHDDHLEIRSATVLEKIFDFTSVDEDWASRMAQEKVDRSRAGHSAGPSVNSVGAAAAADAVPPDFRFMGNANLKKIVERDYAELRGVRTIAAAKSRYVLCGGLIEGLLLDVLLQNETGAKSSSKAPKSKGGSQAKALEEWNLGELIDVAVELKIIETDAQQFSHGVRNYRNLIHPGKEMRSNQKVAREEAEISEKVLEIIIRELGYGPKP
jgi:hypothetical protein